MRTAGTGSEWAAASKTCEKSIVGAAHIRDDTLCVNSATQTVYLYIKDVSKTEKDVKRNTSHDNSC